MTNIEQTQIEQDKFGLFRKITDNDIDYSIIEIVAWDGEEPVFQFEAEGKLIKTFTSTDSVRVINQAIDLMEDCKNRNRLFIGAGLQTWLEVENIDGFLVVNGETVEDLQDFYWDENLSLVTTIVEGPSDVEPYLVFDELPDIDESRPERFGLFIKVEENETTFRLIKCVPLDSDFEGPSFLADDRTLEEWYEDDTDTDIEDLFRINNGYLIDVLDINRARDVIAGVSKAVLIERVHLQEEDAEVVIECDFLDFYISFGVDKDGEIVATMDIDEFFAFLGEKENE